MAENEAPVTKRGRSSSEIIEQFNSLNAKILAAVLVSCLVGYHGILKFMDGNCSSLISFFSGCQRVLSLTESLFLSPDSSVCLV